MPAWTWTGDGSGNVVAGWGLSRVEVGGCRSSSQRKHQQERGRRTGRWQDSKWTGVHSPLVAQMASGACTSARPALGCCVSSSYYSYGTQLHVRLRRTPCGMPHGVSPAHSTARRDTYPAQQGVGDEQWVGVVELADLEAASKGAARCKGGQAGGRMRGPQTGNTPKPPYLR